MMGRGKGFPLPIVPRALSFFSPLCTLPTTQRGLCGGGSLSPASNVTNRRENISKQNLLKSDLARS